MNWKKFKLIIVFTSLIVLGAFASSLASEDVQWDVYQTLQLDETPIDLAVAPDGNRIYVLTEQGQVLIYSGNTQVQAKIEVGKHVDRIKVGPRGDTLILSSGKNKTIQVVVLDFVQKINTSGAPFKGPADAPVVIAVFDDFE